MLFERQFALVLAVAVLATPIHAAGKRLALVIGNNAYRHSAPLKNCVNDARAVGNALRSLGFEVSTVLDAERAHFNQGLSWLETRIKDADLGLVFYSGHGAQVNGVNYLIPVDANPRSDTDIKREGINASEIAADLQQSGCKTNILILDACRNDPFQRGFRGTANRGLAPMQASDDSLIAFAADAGQVADDNQTEENGLYTSELLKHLETPGLPIEEVFKRTRTGVKRRSGKKQVPAEYSKLEGEIVLAPARSSGAERTVEVTPAPAPAASASPGPVSGPDADEDPESQFQRWLSSSLGLGVPKDEVEGLQWLRKAAARGHAQAQHHLALRYLWGELVAKDAAEAMVWNRRAADQGLADAQCSLGRQYSEGQGVVRDPVRAVEWFRKAADQGDIIAQWLLGRCYEAGEGVAKDPAAAVTWYRKAAERDVAPAQGALGWAYRHGVGVGVDVAEAVRWFRKAAEQEDDFAQYNLALCYADGVGVEKDLAEAARWYRKAADRGYASAQYGLALCYADGAGVEKDLAEAARWLRKGADQGDANSQAVLGYQFQHGLGVPKDVKEAARWYRQAADQNHEIAQYNLGNQFETGDGVKKSRAQALTWIRKAANNGHEKSRNWLAERGLKR